MFSAPDVFDHPTFGESVRVEGLYAERAKTRWPKDLRWRDHQKRDHYQIGSPLLRENRTDVLRFIRLREGEAGYAKVARVGRQPDVEWVAPVYRARDAAPGPQSDFAISPTVIVLSAEADRLVRITDYAENAVRNERRTHYLSRCGFVAYHLPDQDAIAVATRLRADPALQGLDKPVRLENTPFISPTAGVFPDDTLYHLQWGVRRIKAPQAWEITRGHPDVIVAVIDDGVELQHTDLNLTSFSYSAVDQTDNGSDIGDHGTYCAGIISSRIHSGEGVAGIAGDSPLLAIATNFSDVQVTEALCFAAEEGARVVCLSLGVFPHWHVWDLTLIEHALQRCIEKDVVLVAAAGNWDRSQSLFPASDPRTLCVGGSNREDMRKSPYGSPEPYCRASYGPDLDVVAPCVYIPTTDLVRPDGGNDYKEDWYGTSAATPHVAAVAALVRSANPSLTEAEVREIICRTAERVRRDQYNYQSDLTHPFGTWHKEVGYGRVDAEAAVNEAVARRVVTVTPAESSDPPSPADPSSCGGSSPAPPKEC